jgi:hypothetical protein
VHQFVGVRVHKEFELHVVRIATNHRGSELGVDDFRVRYVLRLQMHNPSLQFVSIRNPERQVIKADAPFVERAGLRGPVVSHD